MVRNGNCPRIRSACVRVCARVHALLSNMDRALEATSMPYGDFSQFLYSITFLLISRIKAYEYRTKGLDGRQCSSEMLLCLTACHCTRSASAALPGKTRHHALTTGQDCAVTGQDLLRIEIGLDLLLTTKVVLPLLDALDLQTVLCVRGLVGRHT